MARLAKAVQNLPERFDEAAASARKLWNAADYNEAEAAKMAAYAIALAVEQKPEIDLGHDFTLGKAFGPTVTAPDKVKGAVKQAIGTKVLGLVEEQVKRKTWANRIMRACQGVVAVRAAASKAAEAFSAQGGQILIDAKALGGEAGPAPGTEGQVRRKPGRPKAVEPPVFVDFAMTQLAPIGAKVAARAGNMIFGAIRPPMVPMPGRIAGAAIGLCDALLRALDDEIGRRAEGGFEFNSDVRKRLNDVGYKIVEYNNLVKALDEEASEEKAMKVSATYRRLREAAAGRPPSAS